MGAHFNYYWAIYYLILYRSELENIKIEKYQALIKQLKSYNIDPIKDDTDTPGPKDFANILNIDLGRTYKLIKGLYSELYNEIRNNPPLRIKNIVHAIYIALPFDEQKGLSKERKDEMWKMSTYIKMSLPETPRVGDEITIPFLEHLGICYHGYVNRIEHRIVGTTQEVLLWVHPFENYYYQWMKMKENYEYLKRLGNSLH